jgi:GH15 family glucan-1,4-alpha-glucosidase
MELTLPKRDASSEVDIPAIADFIAGLQKENGEIPWSKGGKTDPWDHVESAMGLSVAGRHPEAERAYAWLAATQFSDGSWWSATRDGAPEDTTKDASVPR